MKRIVEKLGKLITVSFFIMALGILLFLLTPLFYGNWGIDTDLIGLLIFITGLAIFISGIIQKKRLRGWKLMVLSILAGMLLLPLIALFVSLIYFFITGKPLGG